ncbi:MAG TPA: bacillithiol system redox-active protein YtxJ [Bacteroidia bacterium]|nr:bacillithiol system redox-active protein YtxJ [Bacteroidia bacterium]HRD37210.1 bacillithiol system redox-active protein YtxJ [Bacteroidia bacterium]
MNWIALTSLDQLSEIDELSKIQPVMIFKHSTRCSISNMALSRVESKWNDETGVKAFYLDLLNYRDVSNAISSHYNVIHQSPQALLIINGKCTVHQSHSGINVNELLTH